MGISKEEEQALKLYKNNSQFDGSSWFAYDLNKYLRSQADLPPRWLEQRDLIDTAFKSRGYRENDVLYRATWREDICVDQTDGFLCDFGFASCTDSRSNLQFHFKSSSSTRPVLLIIEPPEGVYVFPMEELGGFGGGLEREVLLPRGAHFTIKECGVLSQGDADYKLVLGQNASRYKRINWYHLELIPPNSQN